MRHALRPTLRTLTAIGAALATACGGSSSPNPPGPSLTITHVGWAEENIDPSFWTSPPPIGATAYYDFFIHYSGDVAFSDLQSARVYLPGGTYWDVGANARFFDPVNKVIGGWGRWYSHQPGVLPIGPLPVQVKLTNGVTSTSTVNVAAPGSLTAGAFTTMYTEDVAVPPVGSAPMVKRATLGAARTLTVATQTISVDFSVNDPSVNNGFLWVYDAANTYLGGYFFFRNPATGLAGPQLGGVLATDGTSNTVTLHPADLTLEAGASFGQISQVVVVLTDGAQYGLPATGQLAYDCRSISARVPLTVQ